ncbi:phosphoribosylaminoimidazole-succinocarboxamide synthase [Natronospira proteinivora]|uniref:Phosphoribosylaminoimidazole-succinocarboxamide synthase n=1 Tax=Natronospira proteinivora TaxID=1807133 RepID=A0ABT1GB62_9GAMM|nr:phosphoribosylaminoimidazolesuccinocarboxamide synthase [Natronospira proteinivora]MCP1727563.1 phosphoribosylaminoimidazole-succinocarboxamide synthase [Natronospira proteinivora]
MSSGDNALYSADIKSLEKIHSGKVRDLYAVDEHHLLVVASDRLSAFDVVLPDPIPGKGEVLTAISNFWFARTTGIVPNHIADMTLEQALPDEVERARVASRAMVVKRLKPLPIEAIVRGYLIGSGWKDYQQSGSVCGISLPQGLKQADILPQPLFTPSTKAAVGDHDENIGFDEVERLLGEKLAQEVKEVSIALYTYAVKHAESRGLIIADTKFEFGLDENNRLHLIDEALTPDSSRFWPASEYAPGMSPPSFDKQFVRDYLETLDWDKTDPGPKLPADIIRKTAEKYREAQRLLTE